MDNYKNEVPVSFWAQLLLSVASAALGFFMAWMKDRELVQARAQVAALRREAEETRALAHLQRYEEDAAAARAEAEELSQKAAAAESALFAQKQELEQKRAAIKKASTWEELNRLAGVQ